jgi:hypothetical protein
MDASQIPHGLPEQVAEVSGYLDLDATPPVRAGRSAGARLACEGGC